MIVYDALVGHVEVVGSLHSTWPSNASGLRRYIPMAFRLAVGGSGWDLKRDRNGWMSIAAFIR